MRSKHTNQQLKEMTSILRKESYTNKCKLWLRVAEDLEKPTRQRRVVNLSKINRFTKDNEIVIVPGKVLGAGVLNHKLTIAAFAFSESAKTHISNAQGKCLSILELMKQNPKGKDIRIIG